MKKILLTSTGFDNENIKVYDMHKLLSQDEINKYNAIYPESLIIVTKNYFSNLYLTYLKIIYLFLLLL